MRWTPSDIKQALAAELQKTGHSLGQLETILASKPESVEKLAEEMSKISLDPSSVVNSAKTLLSGAGYLGMGLGAIGGIGAYGAYRANQGSNDMIQKKMQEKQQYEEATRNLRAAMIENQSRI